MRKAGDIKGITAFQDGVPLGRLPVCWDRRLPVNANLNVIEGYMRSNEERLPGGEAFDEAAIMVPNELTRAQFLREMKEAGWTVFNEAADLVLANPFSVRYTVEYTFLRHPSRSWRLEVMMLGQLAGDGLHGFSPLHQALWSEGTAPTTGYVHKLPIPHLSFKPVQFKDLTKMRSAVKALDHLRNKGGFLLAQACQSTYGVFWYLIHQDAARQLYLKPRVNTRDSTEVVW